MYLSTNSENWEKPKSLTALLLSVHPTELVKMVDETITACFDLQECICSDQIVKA